MGKNPRGDTVHGPQQWARLPVEARGGALPGTRAGPSLEMELGATFSAHFASVVVAAVGASAPCPAARSNSAVDAGPVASLAQVSQPPVGAAQESNVARAKACHRAPTPGSRRRAGGSEPGRSFRGFFGQSRASFFGFFFAPSSATFFLLFLRLFSGYTSLAETRSRARSGSRGARRACRLVFGRPLRGS